MNRDEQGPWDIVGSRAAADRDSNISQCIFTVLTMDEIISNDIIHWYDPVKNMKASSFLKNIFAPRNKDKTEDWIPCRTFL